MNRINDDRRPPITLRPVVQRVLDYVDDDVSEPMDSVHGILRFWIDEGSQRFSEPMVAHALEFLVDIGLAREVGSGNQRLYQFPLSRRRALTAYLDALKDGGARA